uniref:Uncharacterized protein n=1 Tax=viral metagenome TaxID=1070528 RepID=A0A6C0HVU6_9ZZZZ
MNIVNKNGSKIAYGVVNLIVFLIYIVILGIYMRTICIFSKEVKGIAFYSIFIYGLFTIISIAILYASKRDDTEKSSHDFYRNIAITNGILISINIILYNAISISNIRYN